MQLLCHFHSNEFLVKILGVFGSTGSGFIAKEPCKVNGHATELLECNGEVHHDEIKSGNELVLQNHRFKSFLRIVTFTHHLAFFLIVFIFCGSKM